MNWKDETAAPAVAEPIVGDGKFWLVWKHGGNAPAFRHQFKEDAVAEARRLCAKSPQAAFYVLEAHTRIEAHHEFDVTELI